MIRITVNGERQEIKPGLSLTELLESLKIEPERVAVEKNRDIIRRAALAETLLAEGDVVEIIQFVGGG